MCTASYGMTCGPNGTSSLAADCYPGGSTFVAASYPTYLVGDSCPSPYTAGTSTTYTTYTRSTDAQNPYPTASYFKATNVLCCPPGYDYSVGGCTSTIPETATVQYLCDLNTPTPLTVPYKKTGNVLGYAYITGTAYPSNTWVYEGAVARKIEYVSGSVGTGPWPTATSTTQYYYGSGSGSGQHSGGDDSSSSDSISASRRRKTMSKIIAGVVVPVVVAIIGALLLLCKKKKKNKGPEAGEAGVNNPVQANQTTATNNATTAPQMAQAAQGQSSVPQAPPGYAAPVYVGKQEAVHGVHEIGPGMNIGQTGMVSPEVSKEQQVNALEQEQARIQAEIQRLKNPGS